MDYPEKRKRKSTTIRIPRGLKEEIETFLLTDIAKKAGYDDPKAVVEAAVRRLLEHYGHIETHPVENGGEHPS